MPVPNELLAPALASVEAFTVTLPIEAGPAKVLAPPSVMVRLLPLPSKRNRRDALPLLMVPVSPRSAVWARNVMATGTVLLTEILPLMFNAPVPPLMNSVPDGVDPVVK